jgi:hypothetical protein
MKIARNLYVLCFFLFAVTNSFFCSDPIDIVYTWVDGQDPVWQAAYNVWIEEYIPLFLNYDSHTRNRFRNRDELKYSLRSIRQNAKFCNHIYIVTFGQRPKWLKDHHKITVVDHKEIFQNPTDLPTFNSQAIESNLHRIPGLSEKFIYFNDDVLLRREADESDFFTKKDKIRVYLSPIIAPTGQILPEELSYISAWKNTSLLLNKEFKDEPRHRLAHAPFALKKSLMQEAENRFPDVFRKVSSHKFRLSDDFVITNGLVQYYAYYTDQAKLDDRRVGARLSIRSDPIENSFAIKAFFKRYPRFFCMEDSSEKENLEVDKQVHEFLEKLYPKPAPWEEEATPAEETE